MKKALSILLLIVFVIATAGVVVRTHYCSGILADTSVFNAASCGCGDVEMKGNCCRNESEFFQVDADYVITSIDISFDLKFTCDFLSTFIDSFVTEQSNSSNYLNYKPPLLIPDILILVQCFLF